MKGERDAAVDPKTISFVPLGESKKMNGFDILDRHPTGQKYAYLLKGAKKYPLLTDSRKEKNVLSMPPIINSETSGRVTAKTTELFIEVTGTKMVTVNSVINILACMFKDMGGKIYSVSIQSERDNKGDKNGKKKGNEKVGAGNTGTEKKMKNIIETPSLVYDKTKINPKYVSDILGVDISRKAMDTLLAKMGYTVKGEYALVPPYRTDILHPIDVVDDIARAYSFDNIKPRMAPVFTIGNIFNDEIMIDRMREMMIGLGYNETFTLALTSKKDQFDKTGLTIGEDAGKGGNVRKGDFVEISKAKAVDVDMVRYWMLPEILRSLSVNKERPYPIKLFEIEDVVRREAPGKNGKGSTGNNTTGRNGGDHVFVNRKSFAFVLSNETATFTDAKSVLVHIMNSLMPNSDNREVKTVPTEHPSFISGRCAKIIVKVNGKEGNEKGKIIEKEIGLLGEIHPKVLESFNLQTPVAACEIFLDDLL